MERVFISDPAAFCLIVITPPEIIPGEHIIIRELFDAGLSRLHVRKPGIREKQMQAYMEAFAPEERSRIRLHVAKAAENHDTPEGSLGSASTAAGSPAAAGVHLPYSGPGPYPTVPGGISISVHSWKEYGTLPPGIDYAFISPLFNSISKKGYRQNQAVRRLPASRPTPVIGLGGIHQRNIRQVRQAGFNGAALLGAIWERPVHAANVFSSILDSLGQDSQVMPGCQKANDHC